MRNHLSSRQYSELEVFKAFIENIILFGQELTVKTLLNDVKDKTWVDQIDHYRPPPHRSLFKIYCLLLNTFFSLYTSRCQTTEQR